MIGKHTPVLAPAARGWPAFLAALNLRSASITLGLALLAAALLNPIFAPPFAVVLGRTVFLAVVLLLVFSAARQWPAAWRPAWLAPWLIPMLALVLAAPLATLAVYLLSVGGDVAAFVQTPALVTGFVLIAVVAIVLGLMLAGGATVRERLAQSRAQVLQMELEHSRLEKQALDARLALLQAQIEPHFLFNTLANVQALVENNSPRAADVLKSLIAYLRAAMPRLHGGTPTLGDEVALVRAYLELMQMRMPDRLQFGIAVAPEHSLRRLPPLTLLTLVENAVRHGIDPSEQGGRIDIGASPNDATGMLHLWVADTGQGLDPRAAAGTGLTNLRARLQGFFGPEAALLLSETVPHGVRAELVLPPEQA